MDIAECVDKCLAGAKPSTTAPMAMLIVEATGGGRWAGRAAGCTWHLRPGEAVVVLPKLFDKRHAKSGPGDDEIGVERRVHATEFHLVRGAARHGTAVGRETNGSTPADSRVTPTSDVRGGGAADVGAYRAVLFQREHVERVEAVQRAAHHVVVKDPVEQQRWPTWLAPAAAAAIAIVNVAALFAGGG